MLELFILLILVILYLINKKHQTKLQNDAYNKIRWCIADNYSDIRFQTALSDYIFYNYIRINGVDFNSMIEPQYKLNIGTEHDAVNKILEEYQKGLTKGLARDNFSQEFIKKTAKMNNEEFFMTTLASYFQSNTGQHVCNNTDLYNESYYRESDEVYVYPLTDFGLAYHKLSYFSYLFCKLNPRTNISFYPVDKEREILDTGETTKS